MNDLVKKILLAKNNDNDAMLDIICRFEPLIRKYARLLNYDNDNCHSDLIEKLITLVKVGLDTKNLRSDNDGAVVNYIHSALKNQYILLAKANQKIENNETVYDTETLEDKLERDTQCIYTDTEPEITLDICKNILTEREFIYIKLIVIDGYTAESVAKKSGVTKQAVNQCKRRGLMKLRKFFSSCD